MGADKLDEVVRTAARCRAASLLFFFALGDWRAGGDKLNNAPMGAALIDALTMLRCRHFSCGCVRLYVCTLSRWRKWNRLKQRLRRLLSERHKPTNSIFTAKVPTQLWQRVWAGFLLYFIN